MVGWSLPDLPLLGGRTSNPKPHPYSDNPKAMASGIVGFTKYVLYCMCPKWVLGSEGVSLKQIFLTREG